MCVCVSEGDRDENGEGEGGREGGREREREGAKHQNMQYYTVALENHHVQFVMILSLAKPHMN